MVEKPLTEIHISGGLAPPPQHGESEWIACECWSGFTKVFIKSFCSIYFVVYLLEEREGERKCTLPYQKSIAFKHCTVLTVCIQAMRK